MLDLQKLYESVQKNCHISDGLHAQDYGLCTYLLKMRELYRWEKGLPLTAQLPKEEVGNWLSAREQLWDELVDNSFECLPIDEECYDPFETAAINQALLPQGIVYGGGIGQFCKPSFFIGRLYQQKWREGLEILMVADEYARDLSAPPAMTLGTTIFIRRESVRRTLWERIEGWNWKKPENHFARLLSIYNAHQDIETALDKMTEDEIETVIHHEIGEVQAGRLLGNNWEKMLMAIAGSKAELIARAVRDHLADCLVTLPKLLERRQPAALLLYLANLTGMRHALFPALVEAYQPWLADENHLEALTETVKKGQTHWLNTAQTLLACYAENPADSATLIAKQMETIPLGSMIK
ncbi:MAG: hypothetical protein DRR08_00425 [Candidatus Parabeggiatoa sp. nov. 2]|nr:MAG: hypothetical protein B6247_02775 [Beggiatoa sp. 4572_84]RKZ64516.1 MAG: hypothetical protein DRR08_00425 [Gammaproteobacteria bacterium]